MFPRLLISTEKQRIVVHNNRTQIECFILDRRIHPKINKNEDATQK